MMLPMFNPMYYLFALPALLLGLWAQYRVKSAYAKYQKVRSRAGMMGAQAAQRLLSMNGLDHVTLDTTEGQLSDHYDPRSKRLVLSRGVAGSDSVAALGIVAHEVGHAVQDAQNYAPLKVRGSIVPAVQLGSYLGPILFFAGMFLGGAGGFGDTLSLIGLLRFSGTLVFALVTLPVEFDASNRAVAMLSNSGMISPMEQKNVRAVLNAAALTYVAGTLQAVMTLLYYITRFAGGRD